MRTMARILIVVRDFWLLGPGRGFAFNEITAKLDVRRGIDTRFVKRSNLAFGVEYRRDTYEIEAGEQASYADAESM